MNLLKNLKTWMKTSDVPKVTHESLELAFQDTNGKRYYRIPAVMALPLERFGKAQEFIMWMSAGMSATELRGLISVVKESLGNLVADMVSKEKKHDALVKAGAAVNEMEMRADLVIHTELLYNFVAVHYIREDEPIDRYVESIQQEKVDAFKEMVSQGGAYGFFSHLPELANINKSMNLSPEEWEQYFHASLKEQQRLKKVIEYLKSERKLERDRKTYQNS